MRYPTRDGKNSMRRSQVEFLTSRVGYREKLHELPFPRISPNTTRRSRVIFGLIRGNGNECNFAHIAHGIAKCSQGYLLLMSHPLWRFAGVYKVSSRGLVSYEQNFKFECSQIYSYLTSSRKYTI